MLKSVTLTILSLFAFIYGSGEAVAATFDVISAEDGENAYIDNPQGCHPQQVVAR